jgi:hypothetical protein
MEPFLRLRAVDQVTKAKFELEQRQWLLRTEQAEKTERNLMARPCREADCENRRYLPVAD